jgi:hypothetical protein
MYCFVTLDNPPRMRFVFDGKGNCRRERGGAAKPLHVLGCQPKVPGLAGQSWKVNQGCVLHGIDASPVNRLLESNIVSGSNSTANVGIHLHAGVADSRTHSLKVATTAERIATGPKSPKVWYRDRLAIGRQPLFHRRDAISCYGVRDAILVCLTSPDYHTASFSGLKIVCSEV